MQVSSQRDPVARLVRYQTYAWAAPVPAPGVPQASPQDATLDNRIQDDLDSDLRKQGYGPAPEGKKPDFYIAYYADLGDRTTLRPVTSPGVEPSATVEYRYQKGQLTLEFLDGDSKRIIWRGTAGSDIGAPGQITKMFDQAAEKLVSKFLDDLQKEKVTPA